MNIYNQELVNTKGTDAREAKLTLAIRKRAIFVDVLGVYQCIVALPYELLRPDLLLAILLRIPAARQGTSD